jgi:hypothetical protein
MGLNNGRNFLKILKVNSDSAMLNFMFSKAWNIVSLPLTILCLLNGLSVEEQGYYATFASIQAIQMLFELGMTGIIGQFVAHERAHLFFGANGAVSGEPRVIARLGSIIGFSLRYISTAASCALLVLVSAGVWFFSSGSRPTVAGVDWLVPWLLICLGTCTGMICSTLACIADGLGGVAQVHKIALKQNFAGNLVLWVGLAAGLKLYAPALQTFTIGMIGLYAYKRKYYAVLRNLLKHSKITPSPFSWRTELWPLQWKISCSWLSGVLISQLASPVIFRTWGPAVAGAYGMTVRCVDAILSLGNGWISTRASTFGTLIARKEFPELFQCFRQGLIRSVVFYCGFSLIFITAVWYLPSTGLLFNGKALAERFLHWDMALILVISSGFQLMIGAIAGLARAEKREPFFWPSIGCAILSVGSLFSFGISYGVAGVVYSALVINGLVSFPLAVLICNRFFKRNIAPLT